MAWRMIVAYGRPVVRSRAKPCATREVHDFGGLALVLIDGMRRAVGRAVFRHEARSTDTPLVLAIQGAEKPPPPATLCHRLTAPLSQDAAATSIPQRRLARVGAALRPPGRLLRGLAKILPIDQLEHQLVEGDLCLLVGAGEAHKLTVQVHRKVPRLWIVDDLFLVHRRPPFRALPVVTAFVPAIVEPLSHPRLRRSSSIAQVFSSCK